MSYLFDHEMGHRCMAVLGEEIWGAPVRRRIAAVCRNVVVGLNCIERRRWRADDEAGKTEK